jgi:16S rRNA (cytosine967-C5)-methyltransferase
MATARGLAWHALQRIDQDGAYANLVLPGLLGSSKLDERDRGFVTDLVYGTTRMRRACDALVDRFVMKEPDPDIRTLLRLGAYQLQFADVAPHAAVGETVELAPKRSRGFVNAVLRNVARTPMIWPDESTELSYPQWMVDLLHAELADEARPAMERMNQPPPVTVRDDGYTQDRASQWVAASVRARRGDRVLDLCAAPGGKATAMAGSGAHVVAVDLAAPRAGLITTNAKRVGVRLDVVCADGTATPFPGGSFDKVLLDAPCSGLGALRRRPDARWRISPTDVDALVLLQRRLIESAGAMVRPGGVFVYSVCTITAAESVDHPIPEGFEVIDDEPAGTWRAFRHGWRVLPHDEDTDGMVIIRYRRTT